MSMSFTNTLYGNGISHIHMRLYIMEIVSEWPCIVKEQLSSQARDSEPVRDLLQIARPPASLSTTPGPVSVQHLSLIELNTWSYMSLIDGFGNLKNGSSMTWRKIALCWGNFLSFV